MMFYLTCIYLFLLNVLLTTIHLPDPTVFTPYKSLTVYASRFLSDAPKPLGRLFWKALPDKSGQRLMQQI